MPFLRSSTITMRPARRIAQFAAPSRSISLTPRLRLKEDADRTPEQVEAEKQNQLKKQKEGKAEWNPNLGSQSESNVAADREQVQDHGEHMKKLQEETAKKSEGKA